MPERFPFGPVRDVVGILRAMYAEERRRTPGSVRMRKIERIARELLDASRMAYAHDPGTAPHDRAISQAEASVLRLGDLVSVIDPLEPVVSAAGARVRHRRAERTETAPAWAVGRKPR